MRLREKGRIAWQNAPQLHVVPISEHEMLPGQIGNHHPGESVDQPDHWEADQEHPPHPEDEEVLLVEDVIVENAEIVASVNSSSSSTNVDVTGHLNI